jgi:hypothetical protein
MVFEDLSELVGDEEKSFEEYPIGVMKRSSEEEIPDGFIASIDQFPLAVNKLSFFFFLKKQNGTQKGGEDANIRKEGDLELEYNPLKSAWKVIAGTIPALLLRVIDPRGDGRNRNTSLLFFLTTVFFFFFPTFCTDWEFATDFLMTFRHFITPKEFFAYLKWNFMASPPPSVNRPEFLNQKLLPYTRRRYDFLFWCCFSQFFFLPKRVGVILHEWLQLFFVEDIFEGKSFPFFPFFS